MSYKKNFTICSLSCLTSFVAIMILRFIHVACIKYFYLMFDKECSFVFMHHNLFIHSSINGHLVVSTFLVLWIVLLWTFVYKVLSAHMFSFPLCVYLGVELLDHMVILCLTSSETAKLFSKVQHNSSFSPTMCEGSNFSTSFTAFVVFFITTILMGVRCISLEFWLAFL